MKPLTQIQTPKGEYILRWQARNPDKLMMERRLTKHYPGSNGTSSGSDDADSNQDPTPTPQTDHPIQPPPPVPQPIPEEVAEPLYPTDTASQPDEMGDGTRRNPTRVRRAPQTFTYSQLGQPAWQPHDAQLNSLFIDPQQQHQPIPPQPHFQGSYLPQPTVPQGLPSFNTLPLHHHYQPISGQPNTAPQPTTNWPPEYPQTIQSRTWVPSTNSNDQNPMPQVPQYASPVMRMDQCAQQPSGWPHPR